MCLSDALKFDKSIGVLNTFGAIMNIYIEPMTFTMF